MKTIVEIEAAIKELPNDEVRKLADWLNNYLDDDWDSQMKNDFAAGKLDKFISKVESDIKANQVRDLDEIINNA